MFSRDIKHIKNITMETKVKNIDQATGVDESALNELFIDELKEWKIIDAEKLEHDLDYEFIHPDLLSMLKEAPLEP